MRGQRVALKLIPGVGGGPGHGPVQLGQGPGPPAVDGKPGTAGPLRAPVYRRLGLLLGPRVRGPGREGCADLGGAAGSAHAHAIAADSYTPPCTAPGAGPAAH